MKSKRFFVFLLILGGQLAFADPVLDNCRESTVTQGAILCDISGSSADFKLVGSGFGTGGPAPDGFPSNSIRLELPGYYLQNPFALNVVLTTTPTSYPAGFWVNAGSFDNPTPDEPAAGYWLSAIFLTKSLNADFKGTIRLVNEWVLVKWEN